MRLVALAVCVLALASAAGAATPVTATMTTSAKGAVVGQTWRFAVTVKSVAGQPLPARMRLQILRRGTVTVIGCWKRTAIKPCSGTNAGMWIVFEGKRSGVIAWPARWLGIKLTFQAVVVADEKTLRLRAPITIRPKP